MACYHPLKAYARRNSATGKREIKFVTTNELPTYEYEGHLYTEKLDIPCGRCIGCRLEYSRQWAIRCVLEAQKHKNNYFITLTYDDDHLPLREHVKCNMETGEIIKEEMVPILVRKDVVDFIMRVRNNSRYDYQHEGIKVYYSGEYGEENHRPHYHIIFFNMPELPDKKFYKKTDRGDTLYNSNWLSKAWKKGHVVIGEVNFLTCAYTARYIMKKHKGDDASYYEENGLVPEFSGMSRRPGIAKYHFDENLEKIYRFDEIIVKDGSGTPRKMRPPKYFDTLYNNIEPEKMEKIKENRKASGENGKKMALRNTSLTDKQYIKLQEDNKIHSLKHLPRQL